MNIFEVIEVYYQGLTFEYAVYLAGTVSLIWWLVKTSFGVNALFDCPVRRNNMPAYMPFIPLFIWFGAVPVAILVIERLKPNMSDLQKTFFGHIVVIVGAITAVVASLYLARSHFARRLKGFGLNLRKIHKDLPAALLNLLTISPLVAGTIWLTILAGKYFISKDFEMPQHDELQLLSSKSQLLLRILIVLLAVLIAPVTEEVIFRGLLQTMLRSMLMESHFYRNLKNKAIAPWLPILGTSAIFASVHSRPEHWPALFVLAVCMGYAYEKSGSLLRPIFIHMAFNTISIVAVMTQLH